MNTQAAWIDDVRTITVILTDEEVCKLERERPQVHWKEKNDWFPAEAEDRLDHTSIRLNLLHPLPLGETLELEWGDHRWPVYPGNIVRTDWFDEHYTDSETPLGASYTTSSTLFAVWAPTARSVKLHFGETVLAMSRKSKGIWQLEMNGDWHGMPYEYEVEVNGKTNKTTDPYAKALLPNSSKSVVLDPSRTEPSAHHPRPELEKLQDAIIYELHVRDATSHEASGVNHKGKFAGLTESSAIDETGQSTGIAYIKELGCTHVQLLPVNDFARVDELSPEQSYNWGYDPLHFQVPEGSYSISPRDVTARVKECKEMVQSFHKHGIGVILDVVFNHVYDLESSSFEKLVPGYYFRYHDDGSRSNGTGVGNDFASERAMARRFILDTVDYWLRSYEVDGFRFDLMGVMDIDTMRQIQQLCARESIFLLGEGWNLPTALPDERKATSFNSSQLPGLRFFNDRFRDILKGSLFDTKDTGYVNGNGKFIEKLPSLVSGSALKEFGDPFVSETTQTINYVECHDNHTLWDRLLLTNPEQEESEKKKMHQLATGLTLLSQGVPFLHAGQEWFRSKGGDENSYLSGDEVNQLDWWRRMKEDQYVNFVKQLIGLRKKYPVFRLTTNGEIRKRLHILETPHPVFGYTLLGDGEDFAIYVNPDNHSYDIHLPSSGSWELVATNDFNRYNGQKVMKGEFTFIGPYELMVWKKPLWGRI
ncbi:type I pullulanase [Virgibacillus xinjiangensis]|uniref:Type I pullulanase n=1 Tax=Virgibacillus xinjiangensis TaxID=393090 RepID=A0ABV7CYZ6_9BACI